MELSLAKSPSYFHDANTSVFRSLTVGCSGEMWLFRLEGWEQQ